MIKKALTANLFTGWPMLLNFRTAILFLLIAVTAGPVTASFTSERGEKREMPLRWRDAKVKVAVSSSLTSGSASIKPGSDVEGAVARSFELWSRSTGIEFATVGSERANVSPAGAAGDGVSLITIAPTEQNLSIFVHNPLETPATTRIFFDRHGYITEADIVLNPAQQFSTDGTFGTFDLESVLVHEIGHLLGLDHSMVAGSIMYRNQAKNGHFASMAVPSRQLTPVDVAAVRAIYGQIDPAVECCFRIEGPLPTTKDSRSGVVWAEDPETGQLNAGAEFNGGLTFSIEGLAEGHYRIFMQTSNEGKHSSGSGMAEVAERKPAYRFAKFPIATNLPFEVQFIGTNGQLSKMPLVVESGRKYSVLLAGIGLSPDRVTPGSTSPFITISSVAQSVIDYGNGLNALSFDVLVDPAAPDGSFTLFAGDESGRRSYFPGGIVVSSR